MVENRKCRDVLFLLFFIAYWSGMFVVCGIAFQEGEWPSNPTCMVVERYRYPLAVISSCELPQGPAQHGRLVSQHMTAMCVSTQITVHNKDIVDGLIASHAIALGRGFCSSAAVKNSCARLPYSNRQYLLLTCRRPQAAGLRPGLPCSALWCKQHIQGHSYGPHKQAKLVLPGCFGVAGPSKPNVCQDSVCG